MSILQRPSARRSVGTSGNPTLAGGAVVTRQHPVRGREVVIVHRKRYDDWTLPKGKVHAGESLPAAAVREVEEETGVRIRLGVPLDTIRYEVPKAGIKRVDYWAGSVISAVRRAPDAEVDVVSWLPIRAALGRLTYAHDHFLLEQFLAQPATTPLLLVRHGKAMDRKDWSKKDALRPLAARGRSQSRKLTPMLQAYGVNRLVTSTSTRCVSTLTPYADANKLSIEQHGLLAEEQGVDDARGVRKLIQAVRQVVLSTGDPTAICIHRPVLPNILDALEIAPIQLATGEFIVAHLTEKAAVHAIERHRPIG